MALEHTSPAPGASIPRLGNTISFSSMRCNNPAYLRRLPVQHKRRLATFILT